MIRIYLCLFRRRIPAADERLIRTLTAERDAAYQTGWSEGYLSGHEAGLRERLDDAELALGRAA